MSFEMLIQVLLVDNQVLLRGGIKLILQAEQDIEVVGEAANSGEAIDKAVALSPDVVLIESALPDGGGLAAIRAIKQRCAHTRILVLSSQGDPEAFGHTAAAGAIGYIMKDISPENLVNAIRATYNSQTILSPTIAQQIVGQLSLADGSANGRRDRGNDKRTGLRQHEVDVLSRVAQGLSDKEIAAQLFLSEGAVKSRLRHLYNKLGLKNRAQAAVFALKGGFLAQVRHASVLTGIKDITKSVAECVRGPENGTARTLALLVSLSLAFVAVDLALLRDLDSKIASQYATSPDHAPGSPSAMSLSIKSSGPLLGQRLVAAGRMRASGDLHGAQHEYLMILLSVAPDSAQAWRGLVTLHRRWAAANPAELRRQANAYRLAIRNGTEVDEHYSPQALEVLVKATMLATREIESTKRRQIAAYIVSVGEFASPTMADRVMHLIRSKGYIVDVARRGVLSQVVTPTYRTRSQAEYVVHGLEGLGLQAKLMARVLSSQ
jgi:DNA-binding NarL/FixJ family response regulator